MARTTSPSPNIPLSAGTVTASGAAIRPGESVRALGFAVPVDESSRFVFQQLVPRRVQTGEIAVTDAQGATRAYRRDFELPASDWLLRGPGRPPPWAATA